MFTEDYLMRIINQVLAALMSAIGLRKAGKVTEARLVIDQAIEQLTGLSAGLVDQLEDASLLLMLTAGGKPDAERLVVLGDLYQEEGIIFSSLGQPTQAVFAFRRALRLVLEASLADDIPPSAEMMVKVEELLQRLEPGSLPVDTQLALTDHYHRLLDMNDRSLAAGGFSRAQVSQALARLQALIDSSMNTG